MTRNPKVEACFGLIADDTKIQKESISSGKNIAGENFILKDGININYCDEILPIHILNYDTKTGGFGEKYHQFITTIDTILNEVGFKKISKFFLPDELSIVEGNFRNKISKMQKDYTQEIDRQESILPFFILEVEEIINALIKKLP
jgi:hypothetical protein